MVYSVFGTEKIVAVHKLKILHCGNHNSQGIEKKKRI